MSRLVFLCMLLAIVASCNEITETLVSPAEESAQTDLRITRDSNPINANQAVNVARLFEMRQGRVKTKAVTNDADVYTVTNDEGMPVFYAVNREDNNGFIIVGASRYY